MNDALLPGDVDAGDVIKVPGSDDAVLVKRVRLGQGGFIFTVAPVGGTPPAAEQVVTFTASAVLHRYGHDHAGVRMS